MEGRELIEARSTDGCRTEYGVFYAVTLCSWTVLLYSVCRHDSVFHSRIPLLEVDVLVDIYYGLKLLLVPPTTITKRAWGKSLKKKELYYVVSTSSASSSSAMAILHFQVGTGDTFSGRNVTG